MQSAPQMQCALQASAFEYRQRDGRSDDELPGRPISEARKLKGLEPRTAVQRYARGEVGLRRTIPK